MTNELKASRSLYLCILAISLILVFPSARAQQMTRVQVLSVGNGVAGGEEPIPVTAMIYYNSSAQNYTLRIGVFEAESPLQAVPGIVSSSTDACMTPETAVALCTIPIHAISGREQISFKIGGIFGEQHMPGAWKLEMTAAFYDSNGNLVPNSSSNSLFQINLAPVWLQFVIPSVVPLTVNGVQQPAGTSLVAVPLGDNTLSAPQYAQVNSTTRFRFDHWADGSNQANRTVSVQGNETYEADYVTQYLLTITGTEQNVTGPGWFDIGSNASFSIYPYQTLPGALDAIGVKQTFQGFYENGQLITNQPSGTIVMDGPHTLNAVWQVDYTTPAIIIVGIVIVLVLAWLVVRKRTGAIASKTKRKPRRRRSAK